MSKYVAVLFDCTERIAAVVAPGDTERYAVERLIRRAERKGLVTTEGTEAARFAAICNQPHTAVSHLQAAANEHARNDGVDYTYGADLVDTEG